MHPRDYQEEILANYEELIGKHRRIVVVLPTGGGKTVVAAERVKRAFLAGKRVLFLALAREQVQQAFDKFVAVGIPEDQIGVILAKDSRSNEHAPIQLAGLMTILARDFKRGDMPKVEVVVVDECHHAVAASYRKVLSCYPEAEVMGLTATPERYDGRGMSEAGFDGLLVGATTMRLCSLGHLVAPRVWGIEREGLVNLKGIRADAYGDFAKGEAAARMNMSQIIGKHVEHYEKHGAGRAAVVYACTIEHARAIGGRFRETGHDVEFLFGEEHTTIADRERILSRLANAEPVVVLNVGVLMEGWDCPAAKVCIIARPTRSWTLHMQMIGRFLRPFGTTVPTVLDHAGNVCRLGMPDAERQFRLVMPKREGTEKQAPKAKECRECGAINALGVKECSDCSAPFGKRSEPEEIDGELVEYTGASREQLLWVAKKHGYHPGWVEWALRDIRASQSR